MGRFAGQSRADRVISFALQMIIEKPPENYYTELLKYTDKVKSMCEKAAKY